MVKTSAAKDQYTRITFERRFSPGAKPAVEALQPGETLLGGRVMALAIDSKGAVKACEVVATSGSVTPQYGCSDLEAERFEASVGGARGRPRVRQPPANRSFPASRGCKLPDSAHLGSRRLSARGPQIRRVCPYEPCPRFP